MIEKMTNIVIGVVIMIIITVVVAIPIFNDLSTSMVDVDQNTAYRYAVMNADEDLTLGFSDGVIAINGTVPDDPANTDATTYLYVITDTAIVRGAWVTGTQTWGTSWFVSSASVTPENFSGTFITTGTITFSNGTMTYAVGGDSVTETYTYLMMPDDNGDYGAYSASELPVYVDDDSEIYIMSSYNNYAFVVDGTLDDLECEFALYGYSGSGGSADVTDQITATATYSKTQYGVSNELTAITVNGFSTSITSYEEIFVPLEYKTLTTNSGAIYTMINVIPLLLIVAIIIMLIGAVIVSKNGW